MRDQHESWWSTLVAKPYAATLVVWDHDPKHFLQMEPEQK